MEKLLQLLKPLFNLNRTHPIGVLVISFSLLIVGGYFSLQLIKKIDTDIANLLPESTPSVIALNNLKEQVGGETSMEVAIKSTNFEAAKNFAYVLIDSSLKLYDTKRGDYYFKRAEFKREVEVLKNNALYLATEEELDKIVTYLEDEIQAAKDEANPFFLDFEDEFEDEEDSEVASGSDDEIERFKDIYQEIVPTEFPVNEDSTVLVVKLFPTGSKSNTGYLQDMFSAYDELLVQLNPTTFDQSIEVRFGGRLKRHLEEIQSIMRDVVGSFASGISSVLVLVMVYFFLKKYRAYKQGDPQTKKHGLLAHIIRAPLPLLIIGLPLIMALSYTFGITWFVYGMLNTMTSVLFVILFGMGIDYGLHFYARYIELRADGNSVDNAMNRTYETTGQAIMTSALTTASALYILMIADFRGFSEFGFISGTGIVLTLMTMIYVLPSMLVLAERFNLLIFTKPHEVALDLPKIRYPWSRTVFSVGLILTVIILIFSPNLRFEYDFGKLEPVHQEYEDFKAFKGQMMEASKRNPAYILTDSDQQANALLRAIRTKIKDDTLSPTIHSVESIQERFPVNTTQEVVKLSKIERIRTLFEDPFLKAQDDDWLLKLRTAAGTTRPLKVEDLPAFITERFTTKSGELGKFIIIYPSVGLSDGRNSIAFKNDVGKIDTDTGESFFAASTSIVAADMLDLMIKESPYMVSATLVFIVLFMYFAFRSWRWTMISLLPLIVGLIFTFGIMLIFKIHFNFYNLVVLPAILGIGEDNGVHLAARFREEGAGKMSEVLKSTGQHISIGSFTTMLGFAGLLFTSHPGLYSIGLLAVLGIGMTLFTALTFLPAMVQVLENKGWMKYDYVKKS